MTPITKLFSVTSIAFLVSACSAINVSPNDRVEISPNSITQSEEGYDIDPPINVVSNFNLGKFSWGSTNDLSPYAIVATKRNISIPNEIEFNVAIATLSELYGVKIDIDEDTVNWAYKTSSSYGVGGSDELIVNKNHILLNGYQLTLADWMEKVSARFNVDWVIFEDGDRYSIKVSALESKTINLVADATNVFAIQELISLYQSEYSKSKLIKTQENVDGTFKLRVELLDKTANVNLTKEKIQSLNAFTQIGVDHSVTIYRVSLNNRSVNGQSIDVVLSDIIRANGAEIKDYPDLFARSSISNSKTDDSSSPNYINSIRRMSFNGSNIAINEGDLKITFEAQSSIGSDDNLQTAFDFKLMDLNGSIYSASNTKIHSIKNPIVMVLSKDGSANGLLGSRDDGFGVDGSAEAFILVVDASLNK